MPRKLCVSFLVIRRVREHFKAELHCQVAARVVVDVRIILAPKERFDAEMPESVRETHTCACIHGIRSKNLNVAQRQIRLGSVMLVPSHGNDSNYESLDLLRDPIHRQDTHG